MSPDWLDSPGAADQLLELPDSPAHQDPLPPLDEMILLVHTPSDLHTSES